jgi:hypothetical protein
MLGDTLKCEVNDVSIVRRTVYARRITGDEKEAVPQDFGTDWDVPQYSMGEGGGRPSAPGAFSGRPGARKTFRSSATTRPGSSERTSSGSRTAGGGRAAAGGGTSSDRTSSDRRRGRSTSFKPMAEASGSAQSTGDRGRPSGSAGGSSGGSRGKSSSGSSSGRPGPSSGPKRGGSKRSSKRR